MSPKDDTTLEKLLIKPLELLNSHLDYTSNTSATQAVEIIQSYTNIQPPIDTDDLGSEKGIDYSKLRYLLAAQNWEEADKETYEVMIKAVGKKSDEWFTSDELLNFPCQDIRTIDQLWVNYSNGRFGFSVQKEIYLSVGGKPRRYEDEAFSIFCRTVGWEWDSINYDSGKRGYFPTVGSKLRVGFASDAWVFLFSHRDL
ncbi:MAG: GUN4 domain-containing protein [Dolichospermum sp. DEX182a]|nr:GUN4 domain-containing protein [Dolichospermum sp. DEX182a]QSV64995.1 MAG: GUN4 domain-containing protein [Dolichospermum sp. DL01]